MIPLKRPLITSERLNEKLVQAENISCNSPTPTSSITPPLPPTTPPLQSPAVYSDDHQIIALPASNSNNDIEIEHTLECQHHEWHQHQQSQEKPTILKKKDIKRIKRLEKKQQKQQQKQLKKNKNKKQQQQNERYNNSNDGANDDNENNGKKSNARPSNLKKQSSSSSEVEKRIKSRGVTIVTTTFTNNATNENNTKPLANVKFAFESNNDDNKRNSIPIAGDEVVSVENGRVSVAATNATSQNNKNFNRSSQIDSNGNYDELPLIKIEADVVDANDYQHDLNSIEIPTNDIVDSASHNVDNLKIESCGFSRSSSESIPFIDDSPRHCQNNIVNGFPDGGRFIVLQPQNIGSQSIIYARKIEKQSALSSIKPLPKRDQFDKSAQILYQSLKESIDHHFERVEHLESKLCQVCHEFLLAPDTVKCLTCGLVCHHSCTISQVRV